jgi:ATP-binding cassette, subfamily B (MDR/TAP), member 1
MTVVFGSLANTFGGFESPGSTTTTSVTSESDFNAQVSHFALQFVFIGVGVVLASFCGVLFWTLSGERISRRIRGYVPINHPDPLTDGRLYLQAVLRQNVAFFDRLGAGEVTNRVSNDAELVREGISDKVFFPSSS